MLLSKVADYASNVLNTPFVNYSRCNDCIYTIYFCQYNNSSNFAIIFPLSQAIRHQPQIRLPLRFHGFLYLKSGTLAYLFDCRPVCRSGDIDIVYAPTNQRIAYAPADKPCLFAGFMEELQ